MKKVLAILVLAMSVSTAAWADSGDMSNMYVALDVGRSKFSDACTTGALLTTGTTSCTDTGTAVRIAGGYNFTPMWGVEVSYADLGKATSNGIVPPGIPPISGFPYTADFKATALQFSGTGTFAINDAFSVLAKLGLVNSSTTLDLLVPGFGSVSETATKTTVGFGIGGQYNFNKNIGIRVEYEDLGTFGDSNTTGTSKVMLLSAGLVYHF